MNVCLWFWPMSGKISLIMSAAQYVAVKFADLPYCGS